MSDALTIAKPRGERSTIPRLVPTFGPAVPVVQTCGLTIRRGRRTVLRNVDLFVQSGEIVALHGPNGAGKTTLLACLAGLVRPVSGTVAWSGHLDRHSSDHRRTIGYLGHETGLYGALTARENLAFAGRMHGLDKPEQRATAMLESAGLTRHAGQHVHRLSRGIRQRLALARTVLHRPQILLLDEPFTSLDAAGRIWLVRLLSDFRDTGGSILCATHEVDARACLAPRAYHVSGGTVRGAEAPTTVVDPPRAEPCASSESSLPLFARFSGSLRALGWLVFKDLVTEARGRNVWPAMLLLGLSLVVLIEMQIELPVALKEQVVSGMLWLGVLFAGALALERSFAAEREEGCWRALLLYPVPPTIVYLAKVAVNVLALGALECLLIGAFTALSNVPLANGGLALAAIALLANFGLVSVGVLVSAVTSGLATRSGTLALVLLPLATPVVIAAAAATRLAGAGELASHGRMWLELLAVAALVFLTLGMMIFEHALEE